MTLLAYIDAGTGSMVMQAAIAGVFTMVMFFGEIRHWVSVRFRRNAGPRK